MGSILTITTLKIKCPNCGKNLKGFSTSEDYGQQENTTRCECGFNETYEETLQRINSV